MKIKRITILSGHYGSGKTNIAVNLAKYIKDTGNKVSIADLDTVNPYFRTKDSADDFDKWGIKLISSRFAGSNVDLPSLPQEMYSIVDDLSYHCVVDVGGDDRGAVALGRYAPGILKENNYDMLFVINCYRPLTATAADTMQIFNEIEAACGIKFTAIVNNSNLGAETTEKDVLSSLKYADDVSKASGLPIKMTVVKNSLYNGLKQNIDNLFAINLQTNLFREVF